MKQYNNKLSPPNTAVGIYASNASIGVNETIIASTAAPPTTYLLDTLEIATEAVLSPYVVTGEEPNRPAANVANPCACNVLFYPVSCYISLLTVALNTV